MRVIHNPTLPVFGLLTAFLLVAQGLWAQEVFLNEVDADSYTVPDSLEFVELFGAPNQPLDGHIVVFYKGGGSVLTSTAYAAFDLDGFQTDTAGFFLSPTPQWGVPSNSNPACSHGGDAVALFQETARTLPWGPADDQRAPRRRGLRHGRPDQPLLDRLLTPGQPQLDEWMLGIDNGGVWPGRACPTAGLLGSNQMVLQQPTPGYTNVLDCDGGLITAQGSEDGTATVCVDLAGGFLPFFESTNARQPVWLGRDQPQRRSHRRGGEGQPRL